MEAHICTILCLVAWAVAGWRIMCHLDAINAEQPDSFWKWLEIAIYLGPIVWAIAVYFNVWESFVRPWLDDWSMLPVKRAVKEWS